MRVIVTGSRTWTDREFLWGVLDALATNAAAVGYEQFTVVHGACYPKPVNGTRPAQSADWLAHLWVARQQGVSEHPYPADWRRYGRRAGFVRNQDMVNDGGDFCAGFILPCADPKCRKTEPHGTHGASGCFDLAEAAGIPAERWPKS